MKLSMIPTGMAILGLAAFALAKPAFVKDFASTYGVKPESKLGIAKCSVCHVVKTVKLNAYGKDLAAAMKAEGTKLLTGSIMKKVEGLDSDKDSKSNLVEIRADTNPGDPKSK